MSTVDMVISLILLAQTFFKISN